MSAQLKKFTEFVAGEVALPGRDREIDLRSDVSKRGQIFRWNRLLEPTGLEFLQLASQLDGRRRTETAMTFNENIHFRSDRVPNRFYQGDRTHFFLALHFI